MTDNTQASAEAVAEFFSAIMQGNHLRVTQMLAANIDPNAIQDGFTPLSVATFCGDIRIMECLLERGARTDVCVEGVSVLITAVDKNNLAAVRLLLSRGANPNKEELNGFTPLLRAVGKPGDDTMIVEALINAGADIHAKNKQGFDAIRFAIVKQNRAAVRVLAACGAKWPEELAKFKNAATGVDSNQESARRESEPAVENEEVAGQLEDDYEQTAEDN